MKSSWRKRLFLILSIVFLAGCQSQVAPVVDTEPGVTALSNLPDGEFILFYSTRDNLPAYYLMNPDGSGVQRLEFANLPVEYRLKGVKWNQDLKVFVATLVDEKNQDDLFLIDGAGTIIQRLTTTLTAEGVFSYSPAVKQFAYVCVEYELDICKVDEDGKNPVNLTMHDSREGSPIWTLDGGSVLFVSERNGMPNIWRMDPDGQNPTNISNVFVSEINPSLSPDGSKVLLESQRAENWDIYMMDLDGGNVTNLTNTPSPQAEHTPVWSPDGLYVAFLSDREGGTDLFVMNADGTNQINLTKTPDLSENTFIWSADSQALIFSVSEGEASNIFRIDRAGGQAVNLTNSSAGNVDPQWISN